MKREELVVSPRETLGKKVKALRREGLTPANLYGPGIESVALQADTYTMERLIARAGRNALINLEVKGDGKAKVVMIRDVQRNPLNDRLLHVDLFQVEMTQKVRVEVPLHLVGEAPATKSKHLMLIQQLTSLHVEALPDDLVSVIEVDISGLAEADQAIYVGDIAASERLDILNDAEQLVVHVVESRVEVEEVPVAEVEVEVAEEEEEAESAEETE